MTKKQHQEALKALKEINKLRINKEVLIDKDTVRIDYKWQKILLNNGMTLVISGSMEQHNQIHCTSELLFLCISILDENGVDLKHTPAQHSVLKNRVAELIR